MRRKLPPERGSKQQRRVRYFLVRMVPLIRTIRCRKPLLVLHRYGKRDRKSACTRNSHTDFRIRLICRLQRFRESSRLRNVLVNARLITFPTWLERESLALLAFLSTFFCASPLLRTRIYCTPRRRPPFRRSASAFTLRTAS